MRINQITPDIVGQMHNDLLRRYYQENTGTFLGGITPAVVQDVTRTVASYMKDYGYLEGEIDAALPTVEAELTRKDIYRNGVLCSVDELIPVLAEDAIVRAGVSDDFANLLRQSYRSVLQPGTNGREVKDIVNTSTLRERVWSETEQGLADVFVSVTNASHELWGGEQGTQLQRGFTRQEKVVIADAVGAFVGSVGGIFGAVVLGVVTSLIVNEATR